MVDGPEPVQSAAEEKDAVDSRPHAGAAASCNRLVRRTDRDCAARGGTERLLALVPIADSLFERGITTH